NTLVLEDTYITTLDNVYQDLAYSYAEGKLYGLVTYEDDGYPTSEIHSININGAYYDEENWMDVAAYQEDWLTNRGGVYGLSMAINDEGHIFVLGTSYDFETEAMTETAHLWCAPRSVVDYGWGSYVDYTFVDAGDTGITMDYLQSMTWNHNDETLYWARFDVDGFSLLCELYAFDINVTIPEDPYEDPIVEFTTELAGELSGETCGMFAPLSDEAAAKAEHANVPKMDPNEAASPILRDSVVTMNVGGNKTLTYDIDPWYSDIQKMVWSSSDESVVTVDENGVVTAVAAGSATVTVANAADETKCDTVSIEVTALDLVLEGVITAQTAGIGTTTGVSTYKYEMVDGKAAFGTVNKITAPAEMSFGLSLGATELGRGSMWAVEYGNTGMVYEIDPSTGVVKDVLEPLDGDMLFGLSYSDKFDTFTGIMNYYLYVDLALTHEESALMKDSYDASQNEFTYHKINMLSYLKENSAGFTTGETGNGASSEIVFCGVTTLPGGYFFEDTYKDYKGSWDYSGNQVNYIADQTIVLLDNVGRLWYIDEIVGMTKEADEWGYATYMKEDGSMITNFDGFRKG
ncbi:MAG: Ig-like domain-containing protein, partial [Oscillospiraceae bacterium]|nr:Ig-like domain-containing protein [Oscillospiraceae bacterium]